MQGMHFFCWLIQAYIIVCIVRVIMSFVPSQGESVVSTIGTITYSLTEPLFAFVRRGLPRVGDLPIDFSPAIVIFALGIIRTIIC
jgi:uncharacterized protein YggT (Ycf19 family)